MQSHSQEQVYQEKSELQSRLSECATILNDALLENQELTRKRLELESQGERFGANKAHLIARVRELETEHQQLTSEIKQWKKRCFDAVYKDVQRRPSPTTVTPGAGTVVRQKQSKLRGTRDEYTTPIRNQASTGANWKTEEIFPAHMGNTGTNLPGWDPTSAHKVPHGDSAGVPRPSPILHRPHVTFMGAMRGSLITGASGQNIHGQVQDSFGGIVSVNRDISIRIGQERRPSATSILPSAANDRQFWAPTSPIRRRKQNSEASFTGQRYSQNPTVASQKIFIEPPKQNPRNKAKGTTKQAIVSSHPAKTVHQNPFNRGMTFYFCPHCKWSKAFYLYLQPPLDASGNVSAQSTWNSRTFKVHINSVRQHMKKHHPEVSPTIWPPGFGYKMFSDSGHP
eukprot:scaffold39887_cov229-Amphora_coffeaeformis.AAC.12